MMCGARCNMVWYRGVTIRYDVTWRCEVRHAWKERCDGDNFVGFLFFYAMDEYTSKKKEKTYLVPGLFFLSALSSFFLLLNILSLVLFSPNRKSARVLPLSPPFDQYISFFIFPIILIDIFLKKLVIQFREVKRGYCSLTHSHLSFLNF